MHAHVCRWYNADKYDFPQVSVDLAYEVQCCRGVAPAVQKQTYRGGTLARSMVVSPRMAWENIFMVEVVRSCPEMCRCALELVVTFQLFIYLILRWSRCTPSLRTGNV
jgi:hypothetical protein